MDTDNTKFIPLRRTNRIAADKLQNFNVEKSYICNLFQYMIMGLLMTVNLMDSVLQPLMI
jgi:hypothetical protein